jgi:hypothetical protein
MSTPNVLDGAKVLQTAAVSDKQATGATRHLRDGGSLSLRITRLAMAKYDTGPGIYLFYCDASWAVLTDTFHDSVDDAREQAEFEYEGVEFVEL